MLSLDIKRKIFLLLIQFSTRPKANSHESKIFTLFGYYGSMPCL
jgi:hypothetical protein